MLSSLPLGFTYHLFTKDTIRVMASLMKSGHFVGYYDATGQLVQLSREACGTKKHLLHSVLSVCPAEMFLSGNDFKFRNNLFHAVTLAEHISHNQSHDCHMRFAQQIMYACRSVEPECGNPLLINTDGDGALQNGWIGACTTSPNMVHNRIMWNNVVTLVMLWLEYGDLNDLE